MKARTRGGQPSLAATPALTSWSESSTNRRNASGGGVCSHCKRPTDHLVGIRRQEFHNFEMLRTAMAGGCATHVAVAVAGVPSEQPFGCGRVFGQRVVHACVGVGFQNLDHARRAGRVGGATDTHLDVVVDVAAEDTSGCLVGYRAPQLM